MHPEATVQAVAELARKRLNASEIARRTGVPRSTVREWMRGSQPARARSIRPGRSDACRRCGRIQHDFGLPTAYIYLLGMYLGDGCISAHPRGVYRLRVVLDLAYPGIIQQCEAAMRAVAPANRVSRTAKPERCVEVSSYSKAWPCLLPQHGPGRKHKRDIALTTWQRHLVARRPDLLLRGLVHSDGCRFTNTGRGGWVCPRYSFSNVSDDIRGIFCMACDLIGVRYTHAPRVVYVSRKADVARLDEFIGPKA